MLVRAVIFVAFTELDEASAKLIASHFFFLGCVGSSCPLVTRRQAFLVTGWYDDVVEGRLCLYICKEGR